MTVLSKPERIKRPFAVDFAFTKQVSRAKGANEGDLVLSGYASTWVQDRDGDWVDPAAFDNSLKDYLSKNPMMLYQHDQKKPLGQITEGYTDATGLFVACVIPAPQEGEEEWRFTAYHGCERGTLCTFSIGGYFYYDVENIGEAEEKWIIREVELMEISVVSIPSNPDSIFEAAVKAVSADGGPPAQAEMSPKAFQQMLELLGIEEIQDEELKALDEQGRSLRYTELCVLFQRIKRRKAPPYEAFRDMAARVADSADTLEDAQKNVKTVMPQVALLLGNLYGEPQP